MNEFKVYSISDRYIEYLSQEKGFVNILSNKGEHYTKTRKYIGVAMCINKFCYYIPLSSPKKTDYILKKGKSEIRKNVVPIIRIVSRESDGSFELKGTLRLSNMIPVPKSELILYDLNAEMDISYKSLVQKELVFIRKNKNLIRANATLLYNQKAKNDSRFPYIKNTLDFSLLEQACEEFINRKP